jgi:hypothetical protein
MSDDFRIMRLEKEVEQLREVVLSLQISKALLEGKADQKAVYLAYVISVTGLIISLIGLLI